MDWKTDVSEKARTMMACLGEFSPTVRAEERMVKGVALDMDDRETYKKYLDSDELREMAAAFIEVADWLDKRAEQDPAEAG